jgi:hypothetical protein
MITQCQIQVTNACVYVLVLKLIAFIFEQQYLTQCPEVASENTAALAHMRRSPSTFFDRAGAAASLRPEAHINVPDIFAYASAMPQRLVLSCQVTTDT